MTNSKHSPLAAVLIVTVVLLIGAVMVVGWLYRSNMRSAELTFTEGNFRTVAGLLQVYVKEHGSYPPDLTHFQVVRHSGGRTINYNVPNDIRGPGDRTYHIVLGKDEAECTGPAPQRALHTIPPGGFAVETNHKDDGCYVPARGVSPAANDLNK